ncbi:MAG: hypothetical protein AAFZ09_09885, partial [Pseudomonadota bacterium]
MTFGTKLASAALTAGLLVAAGGASAATVLKLQTSTQSGAFEYTYIAETWAPRLEAMTDFLEM